MANPIDNMSEQSFTPDPLLSSDSYISNDPIQQTQPDPINTTDSVATPPPGFAAAGNSSRAPVGGRSDPKAVPGSDPLLGSDAFIAAEGGSKGPEGKRAKRAKKGSVDGEEIPDWLPAGWTMTTKTRTNGATAGTVDRYYVEPVTGQRFRSKLEVMRYLETGSRNKSKSDASAMPSKKTGAKKKKEAAFRFDFENTPREVTWSLVDEDQGLWKPSIGEEQVPETTAQEWASTFELCYSDSSFYLGVPVSDTRHSDMDTWTWTLILCQKHVHISKCCRV